MEKEPARTEIGILREGRVHKEQFGREPTRVRTEFASADTILVFLENSLTPAERTLVGLGEHERLRNSRIFLQYANVAEFCAPVERISGRTASFSLHPEGSAAVSRALRG